jgi:hypothetical protein
MKYLPDISSQCNDNTCSLYFFYLLVLSKSYNLDVKTEIAMLAEKGLCLNSYTLQTPLVRILGKQERELVHRSLVLAERAEMTRRNPVTRITRRRRPII